MGDTVQPIGLFLSQLPGPMSRWLGVAGKRTSPIIGRPTWRLSCLVAKRRTQWFVDSECVHRLRSLADDSDSHLPWIVARADGVLEDRLPLFSYGEVEYTGPRRWHRDFILEKTAPQRFHGFVPYLDPDVSGDSKHVWEPNRFAWAMWLGIAYQITEDVRYAEKFRHWTLDWLRDNPYPVGINYCSALELAYRNYAWLWSLRLFADYLETEEELLDGLLRAIWVGCQHIEQNLSTYFAPNTHILGEAFGLYAVGAAIPEYRDAARWRATGLRLLEEESHQQMYQDGMHRELSSGYHLYTCDIFLQATLIGRESGFRVSERIETTARRAARRLAELVPQDLILPQFNDCDGGRLMNLVPQPLDAGPSLLAAESAFPDEQFLPRPMSPRGYPLLMTGDVATEQRSPLRRQHTVSPADRDLHRIYDSGLASHRTPDGDYVLLRSSDFGYLDCPHSHDAGLGIIAYLGGTPIFVDSGVGSYTQSEACRNQFRSASGKNTVQINGQGPSQTDGWFSWRKVTDCELVAMRRFRGGFAARGKHSGYSDPPNCHTFIQREVTMLDKGIIGIVDRWDSDTTVAAEARFTLHPGLRVEPARNLLHSATGEQFHFLSCSLNAGEELEILHNEEPYSENYGNVATTRAMSIRHAASARGGMVTFLSRCGAAVKCDHVVEFEGQGDVVRFQLTPNGIELIATSPAGQIIE